MTADLTSRSNRPATAGAAWPPRSIVVMVLPRPVGSRRQACPGLLRRLAPAGELNRWASKA
jgi:hypothetical protein